MLGCYILNLLFFSTAHLWHSDSTFTVPSYSQKDPLNTLKKKKKVHGTSQYVSNILQYCKSLRDCWEKFYFMNKIIFHPVYFRVFNSLESDNESQVYSECCLHMLTRKWPMLWYDALLHRGAMCGQRDPRQRQMKKQVLKQKFPSELNYWFCSHFYQLQQTISVILAPQYW